MLKSKLLIGVVGITILLVPQQLSNGKTVSEFMETDIKTRTIEERKIETNEIKLCNIEPQSNKQKEFVSIQQENVVEVIEDPYEENITEEETYVGKFTITYYCSCKICNGKWAGLPASNGEPLKENYTIATDTSVIPLNTFVKINNKTYKACDTGSNIKGNRIDIFIDNHKKCYELGKVKGVDVYILNRR